MRAEIARMRDADDPSIRGADGLDHLGAIVGATVIDEDDFVIDADLAEGAGQALVHDRDGLSVFVAGDDRGQAALVVLRGLLGAGLEGLLRQRTDPLGGPPQSIRQFDGGLPADQGLGPLRIGIPLRQVPGPRRHGAVAGGLGDAEHPTGGLSQICDGRFASGSDIEAFAVQLRLHLAGRHDEGGADIVHMDEIARDIGIDQGRQRPVQGVTHQVRDQPRRILQRAVDRVEPQIDRGKAG